MAPVGEDFPHIPEGHNAGQPAGAGTAGSGLPEGGPRRRLPVPGRLAAPAVLATGVHLIFLLSPASRPIHALDAAKSVRSSERLIRHIQGG